MRRLRDHGVAMVYTTHKMAEIRAIADRVVVLRDGGLILDKPLTEVSDDDIVTAMIGRELDALFPDRVAPKADPVLEVRDLQVDGASEPVSFSVSSGEIVGLAGLVGAGRTELLEAIFGARHTSSGEILVRGKRRQAQRAGCRDHRGHGDGARGSQDLRCRAVDERARQRVAAAAVVVQRRGLAEGQGPHARPSPT